MGWKQEEGHDPALIAVSLSLGKRSENKGKSFQN